MSRIVLSLLVLVAACALVEGGFVHRKSHELEEKIHDAAQGVAHKAQEAAGAVKHTSGVVRDKVVAGVHAAKQGIQHGRQAVGNAIAGNKH